MMTKDGRKIGRLFITRKAGETVLIGDVRVTVYYNKRKSDQFTLMIDAPVEIPVSRSVGIDVPPADSQSITLTEGYPHGHFHSR